MQNFKVTHERLDDSVVIHLSGQFLVGQVLRLAELLHETRKHRPRRIIVDLHGLSGLDQTGFAFLKATQVHFEGAGIAFTPVGLRRELISQLAAENTDLALLEQWSSSGMALAHSSRLDALEENAPLDLSPVLKADSHPGQTMILIVDDEAQLRRIIGIWLEKHGYSVIGAASASEAVRHLREHRNVIALTLVDYSLGAETGLQTLEALIALNPALKVILMSGMIVDHLLSFRHPNIVAVLAKPFRMEELLAAIRQALDRPTASGS